jgi:hypothetical protein
MISLPSHTRSSPRRFASTPRRGLPALAAVGAPTALFVVVALVALVAGGALMANEALWTSQAAAAPAAPGATTTSVSTPPAVAATPPAAASVDAVVVAPREFSDGDALIAALSGAGARALVVYLPRTALASVTPAAAGQLRDQGYTVLRAGATAPAGASSQTVAALATLNGLAADAAALAAGRRPVVPSGLASLGDDLKLPDVTGTAGTTDTTGTTDVGATGVAGFSSLATTPGLEAPAFLGLGSLPSASQPAAFAAGSVAVSIIFPQSAPHSLSAEKSESWATPDPNTAYDQLDPAYPLLSAREGYIVAEVSKALVWWAARNPAAHLTFVIPAAGAKGSPRQLALKKGIKVAGKTVFEPIDIPSTDDQAWRHPLMRKLGVPSATTADSPPPETAWDNAVRKANGTDWAFTLYCVDSLKKSTGAFPDGAFAYTFDVFGPYAVATWNNGRTTGPAPDGYGPGLFDGVLAHEIGHVFGALDEYSPPTAGYPSTGNLFSGYLWVQNRNAVSGGTTNDVCIMRGGAEGIAAYQGATFNGRAVRFGGICQATRGQIGWRDANGNAIPDVVDTTPTVKLKPATSSDGVTATVSGVAGENPTPPGGNAHGHAFTRGISILKPHDVRYSVDGDTTWTAVPAPGKASSESFTFTTGALLPGTAPDPAAPTRHVISVSATTGNAATSSVVAWGAHTPVTLALATGKSAITVGGTVKLTLRASDSDKAVDPIGFLSGVTIGLPGGAQKTATTGAAGRAVAGFAPRFTGTFEAKFAPAGQSPFEAATSNPVKVSVRARLTAQAAGPSAGRVVRVNGTFRPMRGGVPLTLQVLSDGAWKVVAHTQTSASAAFSLRYTAHAGTVHLRVRFAGDTRNAAAAKALPALAVP